MADIPEMPAHIKEMVDAMKQGQPVAQDRGEMVGGQVAQIDGTGLSEKGQQTLAQVLAWQQPERGQARGSGFAIG